MTTIISNGYYLVADCQMSSKSDVTLRQIDPETLESVIENKNDFLKIRLLDGKTVRYEDSEDLGAILAFTTSGDAFLNSSMSEILSHVDKFNTKSWISTLRRSGSNTVLMVTERYFTIRISIRDSVIDTEFHKPGDIVIDGSGSSHCDLMSNAILYDDSISLEEIMALASCSDEYTSRNYSALGLRERIFYPNITPSKTHCIRLAKGLWSKVGDTMTEDNIY